jgi:hypothetical protein
MYWDSVSLHGERMRIVKAGCSPKGGHGLAAVLLATFQASNRRLRQWGSSAFFGVKQVHKQTLGLVGMEHLVICGPDGLHASLLVFTMSSEGCSMFCCQQANLTATS